MKAKILSPLIIVSIILNLFSCSTTTAEEIISYGSKYMVGDDKISSIYSKVDGQTTNGKFKLYIWSTKNDSVRFQQITTRNDTIIAAGYGSEGWLYNTSMKDIDTDDVTFLNSHEIHMIFINPFSRLSKPKKPYVKKFMGEERICIEMQDKLGNPAYLYYDQKEFKPIGCSLTNPFRTDRKSIDFVLKNWKARHNYKIFNQVKLYQDTTTFIYNYVQLDFNRTFPKKIFETTELIENF